MKHDSLIFDLDGTISDPAVGIERSINHALAAFGYPRVSGKRILACIGPPIDASFRALTGADSEEHILALVTRFRDRYDAVGYAENSLYPGIEAVLGQLAAAGRRMGVCTSKRADFAEKILAMFGLRELFAFVSGGDVGVSKASQLAALLREGAAGKSSVMIGDRVFDVQAAEANGLCAFGVLWGYGSEAELREAGAVRIYREPGELVELSDPAHWVPSAT